MKTAEPKRVTHAIQSKNSGSFFRQGSNAFFGPDAASRKDNHSFFAGNNQSVHGDGIQAKLNIGQPNDKYEHEADTMADKVVQRISSQGITTIKTPGIQTKPLAAGISSLVQRKCAHCEEEKEVEEKKDAEDIKLQRKPIFESNPEPPDEEGRDAEDIALQRKCAHCEEEKDAEEKKDAEGIKLQRKEDVGEFSSAMPDIENKLNASDGSGSSLPESTRGQMESSFGADFSGVKIHTDSSAVDMSKDLNAQAFTHGNDIYFNAGKFDPNSRSGKHLLAHELTHTIQQDKQLHTSLQRSPDPVADQSVDKDLYQFIPTATLRITLGTVYFDVSSNASFQPGPVAPQVYMIIVKNLAKDKYHKDLIEPLMTLINKDQNIYKKGKLRGKKDSYEGELIHDISISIDVFVKIATFLGSKGIQLQLSDSESEQIRLAIHNFELYVFVVTSLKRVFNPIPAWFDKSFFDNIMLQHKDQLMDWNTLVDKNAASKHRLYNDEIIEKSNALLTIVYEDIKLLESIRRETSLQINPVTQLAYRSIWALGNKPVLDKPPNSIKSITTAMALLKFGTEHPDLAMDVISGKGGIIIIEPFLQEFEIPENEVKVLDPYPSFIVAPDLNPDNSTVTTAKNAFRHITRFEDIHGSGLVHGTTVAMQITMYYSWQIFNMPASLKKMKESGASPESMVPLSNEFVKNSPHNLGQPVDTYKPERRDRERRINMSALGIGDFIVMGTAAPVYTNQMQTVQKPSNAGYPISVFNAKDLARMSAFSNLDALNKLKAQRDAASDPKVKEAIEKEIEELEPREGKDLLALTTEDISKTKIVIGHAQDLRKYISDEYSANVSFYGNKTTDPFIVRLRKKNVLWYELFKMIRQGYPAGKYSELEAVDEYIKGLKQQEKDLGELKGRTSDAYDSFKPGAPVYRVVGGLVKEDDGNLVPLILIAGYHPDADPDNGKYKIKLVDVTFKAPKKKDMIYVGDEVEAGSKASGERAAIDEAFDTFAHKHQYGKGMIVYRLPGVGYSGSINSYTSILTYLEYAIAAIGLAILIAGAIIVTFGTATPAIITALGVLVGVAGAIISIRNLRERHEKGVLEWDSETALDIINIIAGAVAAGGAITKAAQVVSRSVNLLVAIERAKGLMIVYDAVNIAANVYLVHAKVGEDTAAIKKLNLPKNEEDELLAQVSFDAIQQGAMLVVSGYSYARGLQSHYQSKLSRTSYHSWRERGWIEEVNGKLRLSENAPPFLRAKMTLFGTGPNKVPEVEAPEKTKVPEKESITPPAEKGTGTVKGDKKGPTVIDTPSPQANEPSTTKVSEPASVNKNDSLSERPVNIGNENHEVIVTKEGVGICSPDPCTVIGVEYKKELDGNVGLSKKYDELQKLRIAGKSDEAALEGALLIRELEAVRAKNASEQKMQTPKVPDVSQPPTVKPAKTNVAPNKTRDRAEANDWELIAGDYDRDAANFRRIAADEKARAEKLRGENLPVKAAEAEKLAESANKSANDAELSAAHARDEVHRFREGKEGLTSQQIRDQIDLTRQSKEIGKEVETKKIVADAKRESLDKARAQLIERRDGKKALELNRRTPGSRENSLSQKDYQAELKAADAGIDSAEKRVKAREASFETSHREQSAAEKRLKDVNKKIYDLDILDKGLSIGNPNAKGDFAEIKATDHMGEKGFEQVGGHEERQGIDRVFRKEGKTVEGVIAEVKYVEDASIYVNNPERAKRELLEMTNDGPQLSEVWTRKRIAKAVNKNQQLIDEIQSGAYKKWLLIYNAKTRKFLSPIEVK